MDVSIKIGHFLQVQPFEMFLFFDLHLFLLLYIVIRGGCWDQFAILRGALVPAILISNLHGSIIFAHLDVGLIV